MWFHKQSSLQPPRRHPSAHRLRLAGFAVLGLFVLAAVIGMNFSRFAAYLKQGVSGSSSSQVSSALQNNILNFDQQPVKSSSSTAVLTYKNDTFRSGQTDAETTLTTHNVNASQFGKRISYKYEDALRCGGHERARQAVLEALRARYHNGQAKSP